MPKATTPRSSDIRHNPLSEEYSPSQPFKQKAPKKRKRPEEDETAVIDTKASRQILRIGRELEEEDAEERRAALGQGQEAQSNPAFEFDSRFSGEAQSEEDEEDERKWDDEETWGDEEVEEVEVDEIDPADLETFNKFLPSQFDASNLRLDELGTGGSAPAETGQTTNLADLILAKIAQHEAALGQQGGAGPVREEDEPTGEVELPPKVVETYTIMAGLLQRYRSGKLPKAFKILPTLPLPTLLAILPITQPEKWSPNAIFEATRLFISSKSPISQGFLSNVLLERVRDDINETKKLNVHLYNSIKKALFKPKDFFKGFLFPLLNSGTATLREAHIISSVLVRVSIPVIHSAVCLAKLCEIAAEQMSMDTESAGATNIFIRVLLEKKYALPFQTIDALVFHFLRFRTAAAILAEEAERNGMDFDNAATNKDDPFAPTRGQIRDQLSQRAIIRGKLPVIWHQCFLAFAVRYKDAITEDQREALLDLLLDRGHKLIGPEIRRELLAGRGRGVPAPIAGDETMAVDSVAEPQVAMATGFGVEEVAAARLEGGDDTMMSGVA